MGEVVAVVGNDGHDGLCLTVGLPPDDDVPASVDQPSAEIQNERQLPATLLKYRISLIPPCSVMQVASTPMPEPYASQRVSTPE